MSNRGRQNVASFLIKDLGIDWRMGAEWFESQLLDHDVCSNYGNWNYAAGIGKVEQILKGSLDSISSPSLSVKIQIRGHSITTWTR